MNQRKEIIFSVIVLSLVVIALAAHPLIDPDLGWNLAGGLWILDNLKIPQSDPLAALASPWIDYCYLPQILFAGVFKFFGFYGLSFLQIFTPTLMFIATGFFIFRQIGSQSGSLSKRVFPVVLAAILVLFIAPIFHLRPQLFSAFLFALFLQWRAVSKNLLLLTLILVVWSNTHVYWIFAPVILVADYLIAKVFREQVKVGAIPIFISILAPMISPYGYQNYLPIIQYSFFHSHVKNFIQEFQPLIYTEGYLLPVACLLFAAIFYYSKNKLIGLNDLLLSILFFVLALWQMKFTPIFGIFGVFSLVKTFSDRRISLSKGVQFTVYGVSFVCSLVACRFVSPMIGKNQQELLSVGNAASNIEGPIFTQFNAGGWIELGLYLSNNKTLARPWIDGRTLVMGEERLTDYFSLSLQQIPIEKYFKDREIEYLVLNKNSSLVPLVFPQRAELEFETESYFLLHYRAGPNH